MTKVIVESAIELSESQVKALTKKVDDAIDGKVTYEFNVDPDLVGGIRLITPKKTIDMSLSARLSQLNHTLQSSL